MNNQEWKLCVDATGRQYIYNEKLGCSRWLWERYYDENTKHFYLSNVLTGQSIWEVTTPTQSIQAPYSQTNNRFQTRQPIAVNQRPQVTEYAKQTNQLEFYTPDGRKYYWDPVTKTSRWATETTNLNNNKTKQELQRVTTFKGEPKVSLQYKQKVPVKQAVFPTKQNTPFEEPILETSSRQDTQATQPCDKSMTSVQSNSRTTVSESNSIVQSVSETDIDSKNLPSEDIKGSDSLETGLQQNLPSQVKRRKKPKGNMKNGTLLNALEPVVMKADSCVRIIGTSVALEKPYLRLTSVPDPKDVRSYAVLKKALRLVKNKYKKKTWSYNYACEQLKSIRQDMTVQGIEDSLAVQVYETHGRLALENNDMDEFIQCLTCLSQLYTKVESEHRIEFIGYRILYATYVNSKDLLTSILCELNRKERNLWEVYHATQVWKAVSVDNWNRFFKLYAQCPHLGFYLMDKMKSRVRENALNHLRKAFKVDNIEVDFICKNLGFENISECIQYFEDNEFIFEEQKRELIVSKR